MLTESDIKNINKFDIDLNIDIKKITVEQLSEIALILIHSEYQGKLPEDCILLAEALKV